MRYLLLVLMLWLLSGCVAVERHRAEAEYARAQQQQAIADAEWARTNAVMTEQETARLEAMAKASRPPYGWITLVVVVLALVWLLNRYMQMKAALAMNGAEDVRLLPGDAGWHQALCDAYGDRWTRRGDEYYLDSGERVTALIEQK